MTSVSELDQAFSRTFARDRAAVRVHACFGQKIAGMEGRTIFEYVTKRFPDTRSATDPDQMKWHGHAVFHRLKQPPVRLGADRREA